MALKVQIDNYWFTYFSEGDSTKPVILFLHGFMGDIHEFKKAIMVLSKRFYCVAVDLPGHGNSYVNDQVNDQDCYYTIQFTANFVIKFLALLRVDRCFLVGYSMGGRLALYLALHYPQYFYKVVLESASAGLCNVSERSDRLDKDRKLATELESGDFQLFLENWYQQPIFASMRSRPDFMQMFEQRLKNSPIRLAKSLRNLSIGVQPSLWEYLTANKLPLLLLAGELDIKFVQINRQMQQMSKFSKLEIIPNCGHNIHFENLDVFIEKIQDFFVI